MPNLRHKTTTHTFIEWREQLEPRERAEVERILARERQNPGVAVHTFHQQIIVALARLLDGGGETHEYIRDLDDAE